MKRSDLTTNLLGFSIFSSDKNSLLEILFTHLRKYKKTLLVFTPNSEQIVLSKKENSFAKDLGLADILIPDGAGLLFASKILAFFGKGKRITERITGIDLSKELLRIAKKNKLKVLIIGGRDYEGREYDGQKVKIFSLKSGTLDGDYEDGAKHSVEDSNQDDSQDGIWWAEGYNKVSTPTDGEKKTILSTISALEPSLVFVAFGAPNQERWIINNIDILNNSKVSIAMAVGGTFDVLFGKINRAPEWMQNLGLEWLYRLIGEPWRWRRQLRLLEFIKSVAKEIFS